MPRTRMRRLKGWGALLLAFCALALMVLHATLGYVWLALVALALALVCLSWVMVAAIGWLSGSEVP